MGQTREQRIIRQISGTPTTQLRTPIATDMFLPNHSGVSDKQIKRLNDVRHTKYFSGIQEAINDLPTTGGTVFVDAGTYTITSSITIPSNVSLIGEGKSSKIFLAANSNVDLIQNADTTLGNENIIIENLEIDGNSANQAVTPEYSCIYFYKADKCQIKNCYIHDTVSLAASDHRGCCIYLDDSDDNQISNCICSGGGYDNISMRNASHGNIVLGNTLTGAILSSGVQSARTTKNGVTKSYDNIIKGNVCYSNNNNGVVIHYAENCVVDGNVCHDHGHGGVQLVEHDDRTIVCNNVCYNNNLYGISSSNDTSSDCIISNNIVYNNPGWGIYLKGDGFVVIGNKSFDNTTGDVSNSLTNSIIFGNIGYTADNILDHDLTTTGTLYLPGLKKIDGTTPAADGDALKFEITTGRIYGG